MIIALLLISMIFISGCASTANEIQPDNSVQEAQGTAQEDNAPKVIQTDCPFGRVNDPYPGECGRYTDGNNDGVCDLSQ